MIMLKGVSACIAQRKSQAVENKTKISEERKISRQGTAAVNQELDAQLQKTNDEVELIRLKVEHQTLNDVKQAENDLEISIQEFQKEEFPEEIK